MVEKNQASGAKGFSAYFWCKLGETFGKVLEGGEGLSLFWGGSLFGIVSFLTWITPVNVPGITDINAIFGKKGWLLV
jgi:hypothetical protein